MDKIPAHKLTENMNTHTLDSPETHISEHFVPGFILHRDISTLKFIPAERKTAGASGM